MLKNFALLGVGLAQSSGEVGIPYFIFIILLQFLYVFQYISTLCFGFTVTYAAVNPQVCITDPDLIEKSNLNRQFLFRPHHIQVHF